MQEHELWITALFNQYLAGPANSILTLAGMPAADPAKPWANFVAMQFVVIAVLMVTFALLRPRLSMDRPGTMQHVFELVYGFLRGQTEEVIGREGPHYLYLVGTLFFFILFSNLIGIIPAFESPTMFPPVPLGCALLTFSYYNSMGFRVQGPVGYLKHFAGPVWWLSWLMFPIEIISHFARPLSLTIRLYANMFAGEQVTLVFLGIAPLGIPVIFMGLHTFVAFLQSYIFALLTMVYLQGAVEHAHDH